MDNADRNHWRRIRDKKSRERKELNDKNDFIYRNFRSPAYTTAQREIYRQEWERQKKAIEKLDKEIYTYDCKLCQKSPDRNVQIDRGRSKTPGPSAWNAAQVPAERRSRSASRFETESWIFGSENIWLRQSRENERHLFENESLSEDYELLHDENISLQLYVGDLEHENNLIRDEMQRCTDEIATLNVQIEILINRLPQKRLHNAEDSTEIVELQQQIHTLNETLRRKDATLYNLKNETIPQLERERDECQAAAIEKIKFYDEIQTQLEEAKARSRQNSADCQERLLEYQKKNQNLQDEKSKIFKQNQLLREKKVEAEGKNSSLSERLRIESEEKSRLKRENTLLQTQLNSIKREREWNDESNEKRLTKIIEENDRLKEELFTYQRESLKVPALQQNEIEMRQQLDDMKKRIEKLKKEKRENETTLLSTRSQPQEIAQLQSDLRSKDMIEKKLIQAIGSLEKKYEALQQKETDMTLKIDDITKRNEQLQKEKSADKSILLSLQDYKAEITQLQSIIRSKEVVEDRLRQTIGDLEKKCETVQRDVYERLHDMEDRDKKKKQLKERNDKELQRLRQLEIMHENNMKSMRSMESNHTDLEKKTQQLQAEKDMLLKRESMQQNETKRLQNKLDTEERESAVLRERIKELERQNVPRYDLGMIEENRRLLAETEQLKKDLSECKQKLGRLKTTYENDVESLKSNHTDLDKKVQHLKDEKERYYRNEQSQKRITEELQSDLDAERKISADLRERITDLRNERSEKIELERHQVSVENDKEFTRLRRSEKAYKNETETLKTQLADLQKNFELLEEERDQLVESEETERKMGEKLQRELDDAKREVERLQDKTQNLERQITVSKVDRTVNEENSRLKKELEDLRIKVQKVEQKFADNEETLRRYTRQVESLQREKRQAIAEKESALTRLSALAGDRLRDNNAAIADLSDENRPINLGEKFSELYDNQWTDAIEKLEKLMSERDAIQKLLEMIKDIYDVCRNLAKDQLDQIAKAFGFEERKEKMKRLKDLRKSMASENIGDIKKKVDVLCVSKTFSRESSDCSSYISRSVELCWYMCIQDPPVILEFNATHGQVFDDKIYRHFTKSGKTIDYMVWPVMYLHSNGPLLQKGVVQPM